MRNDDGSRRADAAAGQLQESRSADRVGIAESCRVGILVQIARRQHPQPRRDGRFGEIVGDEEKPRVKTSGGRRQLFEIRRRRGQARRPGHLDRNGSEGPHPKERPHRRPHLWHEHEHVIAASNTRGHEPGLRLARVPPKSLPAPFDPGVLLQKPDRNSVGASSLRSRTQKTRDRPRLHMPSAMRHT